MPRCDGCPCEGMEWECPAIARPVPGLCEPDKRARYTETLVRACLAEQHPLGTDRTNGRKWDDAPKAPPVPAQTHESPGSAAPWPAPPRDHRVRVGVAFPLIWLGGVEAWAVALARTLDPARIAWIGVAVEQIEPCDATARARLETVGPVRFGPGQVEALAKACDVLIVWGSDPPPAPRPCKALLVAHGQGEWTRNRMQASRDMDAIAAVSVAALQVIPEDQRARAKVIPNCVDFRRLESKATRAETRARWGVPAGARVALYVGRFSPEKRPETFVRMVANLPDEWQGVMVGKGMPDAEIAIRAQAEALAPGRIAFPGPTDDVGGAIGAADVGVIPSEQEGCCLVMLEMLASGLPVVATPVGHALELAGMVSLVRHLAEGPELADAVLETLADPALPRRIAMARGHVEDIHGPEAFSRAWSDLICEMDPRKGLRERMRRLAKARTCPDRGDPQG